jgi:hypothetical protein
LSFERECVGWAGEKLLRGRTAGAVRRLGGRCRPGELVRVGKDVPGKASSLR